MMMFPTLPKKAGTTAEPSRNRRGTMHGLLVPARGRPPKGASPTSQTPTPSWELPHGMTATELLDATGPSWSAMTDRERHVYPRR